MTTINLQDYYCYLTYELMEMPEEEVLETRKGVALSYTPTQIAI